MLQDFSADAEVPCFFGCTWTWRKHDTVGLKLFNLFKANFVVSEDDDLCAKFSDVLDKVVHERIVIVNYQNFQAVSPPAFSSALISASALWLVSNHSRSGTESATMPAPA